MRSILCHPEEGFNTAYHYACSIFNPIDIRAVRDVIEVTGMVLAELDFQHRKEEQWLASNLTHVTE